MSKTKEWIMGNVTYTTSGAVEETVYRQLTRKFYLKIIHLKKVKKWKFVLQSINSCEVMSSNYYDREIDCRRTCSKIASSADWEVRG